MVGLSLANTLGNSFLLSCVALYAIPRTSMLGAILLTGYLRGAVATHLRAGDPLFSHVLFPDLFGRAALVRIVLGDDWLRVTGSSAKVARSLETPAHFCRLLWLGARLMPDLTTDVGTHSGGRRLLEAEP